MLTCQECINRLFPGDPRVKAGRYNLCGCDYCCKPYKELEVPREILIQEEFTKKQWDAVTQLRAFVLHLQNKINAHIDKSKKVKKGTY